MVPKFDALEIVNGYVYSSVFPKQVEILFRNYSLA